MVEEKWTRQPMRLARREFFLGLLKDLSDTVREADLLSVEDAQKMLKFISDKIGERYTVVEVSDGDKASFFIWDTVENKVTDAGEFADKADAVAVAFQMSKLEKEIDEDEKVE